MDSPLAADEVRWNHELSQYRNALWEPHDSDPPQRLYHYSRIDNIEKILKSKEIWLTDVRRIKQDKEDGVYWLEVFRPIIAQHRRVPDSVIIVLRASPDFGLGHVYHLFVACFSAREDLTHQWKNFAEDGSGCAIEVDYNALFAGAAGGKSYAIASLLYDRTKQEGMARSMVQKAVELTCKVPKARRDRYWSGTAAFEFLVCGQRFKRTCYKNEDEWRLMITATDTADLPCHDDGTPHGSLPLAPDLVTGVVKGPKCVTPDEVIQGWLEQGGYPGVVRQCPVPFP